MGRTKPSTRFAYASCNHTYFAFSPSHTHSLPVSRTCVTSDICSTYAFCWGGFEQRTGLFTLYRDSKKLAISICDPVTRIYPWLQFLLALHFDLPDRVIMSLDLISGCLPESTHLFRTVSQNSTAMGPSASNRAHPLQVSERDVLCMCVYAYSIALCGAYVQT